MRSPGRSGLLFTAIIFLVSAPVLGQVYFENFTGEANGATSGTAVGGTWSTTLPTGGAGSFCRADVGAPYGGILRVDNTGTEGVWRSNVLNIAALGEVALEVLMGGIGTSASDYVRAYYRIDGGSEVMFAEVLGQGALVVFTASSAVVSGSTLQIVIRGMDASGGGGLMGFDDVTVTDISLLYSRASTAWNVGSTWSTTGFAGASCACTPDGASRVIIGGGRSVTFTADGNAAGIEIQNTGTLTWLTNNNSDLTIDRGGAVLIQSGGILTRGITTGSTLQFGNYTYAVNNAGTLNIGALVYTGSGNSVLTNSGTMTLATTVGLSIAGGNGYTFNNSGTLNFAELSIGGADITVNNSGTINQTGNFTGVDAGSSFNNLAGGTWNFGGSTITNVRLFANNNSNTFNYNRAGNQTIITPQNAYSNLTLSGSGIKTATANFNVNGNWTRSGTATYTNGGFRVTLNGSIAQTISAVSGETFANLTINNSFGTSPQIVLNNPVTVSTNLTMTDGNVDLDGNTFTLSSNAAGALTHSLASTAGWMYGGSITRAFPTTAIAVGNVAGYFPMGTATNSRPFFLGKNNPANSNGTLTISYTDANSATNVTFNDGATPIQRRHNAFWHVTKTGMTAGTFDINAGGTGFTIGAVNETRLTRQNDAIGIGTAAASVAPATDIRVRRTGVPAAGLANDFYLASTNSVNTPLPVELDFFHARVEGDIVITSWKTSQEKNNDYFTVEKTVDFETFYEVGRLESKGNDAEGNSYSLDDELPFPGRSYYRLKQSDFDGAFKYSSPVVVEFSEPESGLLKAFPNPSDGKNFTLEVRGVSGVSVVPVSIYNQQGQKIMEVLINADGSTVFRKEISLTESLATGIYVVKAGRTKQLIGKLVVK